MTIDAETLLDRLIASQVELREALTENARLRGRLEATEKAGVAAMEYGRAAVRALWLHTDDETFAEAMDFIEPQFAEVRERVELMMRGSGVTA